MKNETQHAQLLFRVCLACSVYRDLVDGGRLALSEESTYNNGSKKNFPYSRYFQLTNSTHYLGITGAPGAGGIPGAGGALGSGVLGTGGAVGAAAGAGAA